MINKLRIPPLPPQPQPLAHELDFHESASKDSRNVNTQKFIHLMTKVREIMAPDIMNSRPVIIQTNSDALRAFDAFEDRLESVRRYMDDARANHPSVYLDLRKTDHRAWLRRVVAENTFHRTAGGVLAPRALGTFPHILAKCPEPLYNRVFAVAAYVKTHDHSHIPTDDLYVPNKTFTRLVMQALRKTPLDEIRTWQEKIDACTETDAEFLRSLFLGIEIMGEERSVMSKKSNTILHLSPSVVSKTSKKIKIDTSVDLTQCDDDSNEDDNNEDE